MLAKRASPPSSSGPRSPQSGGRRTTACTSTRRAGPRTSLPSASRVTTAAGPRARRGLVRGLGSRWAPPDLAAGRIDDNPPQPRLERSLPAEVSPPAHGKRKPILDSVAGKLAIAADRGRHPAELGQARAIDAFDRLETRLGGVPPVHLFLRRSISTQFFTAPRQEPPPSEPARRVGQSDLGLMDVAAPDTGPSVPSDRRFARWVDGEARRRDAHARQHLRRTPRTPGSRLLGRSQDSANERAENDEPRATGDPSDS